jgi:hypothetical protein
MLSAATTPEAGAEGIDLNCASITGASAGIVEAAIPQITHASGGGMDAIDALHGR